MCTILLRIDMNVSEMTEIEKLLDDYSKKVFGSLYDSGSRVTIKDLIRHSEEYRSYIKKCNQEYLDSHKKGYEYGYRRARLEVEAGTILLDDLRRMTIQELTNLIGESADYD